MSVPDRLTAIQARVDAVAPGAWFNCLNDLIGGRSVYLDDVPASSLDPARWVADMLRDDATADFIAAAREDIPYLLAELAGVRAELATANEALDTLLDDALTLMDHHVSPEVDMEARRRIIERHGAMVDG